MNILVIGGSNLVGPWIVKSLLKHGHHITVFNRGKTQTNRFPQINHILGDRRYLKNYQEELQKIMPDVVIDMIALTEHDALQLIELFRFNLKRLVLISSGDVYKAHEVLCKKSLIYEKIPLSETSPLREHAFPYRNMAKNEEDIFYFYDKNKVENIIHQAETHSTILRFPFVYGPGDHSRLLPYIKEMIQQNETIFLDKNKALWSCTRGYVEDIAEAVVAAALDEREGKFIYNVGEKNSFTEKQWIEKIAQKMNWQGNIIESENNSHLQSQEPYDWKQAIVYDTTKIRKDLSYQEHTNSDKALEKAIHWSLENREGVY